MLNKGILAGNQNKQELNLQIDSVITSMIK